jgi:ABC-2 type transport system permease protein
VLVTVTLGVLASRAVTSAFAAMLRSRRVRDLAAVIIALLATSSAPIQWTITAAAQNSTAGADHRVADVLAWTPLARPARSRSTSRPAAGARWRVGSRSCWSRIVLLLRWWARTLESAMLYSTSGGAGRSRRAGVGGAVSSLIPVVLRPVARPGPFGAIVAREARFWWRDGRRRAALVSILMALGRAADRAELRRPRREPGPLRGRAELRRHHGRDHGRDAVGQPVRL